MSGLDALPTLSDALKFNVTEFFRYATGVEEYKHWCGSAPKLNEWCDFLKCDSEACLNMPPDPNIITTTIAPALKMNVSGLVAIFASTPLSIGENATCYDTHWCEPTFLSSIHFHTLGIVATICCLLGVLMHFICLPTLNFTENRSGCSLLLSVISVCDIIFLLLFACLYCWPHLISAYDQQFYRYGTQVAPISIPLRVLSEATETMVLWILITALLDRFLFLKFGVSSKRTLNRLQAFKWTLLFSILLVAYSIPKLMIFAVFRVEWSGLINNNEYIIINNNNNNNSSDYLSSSSSSQWYGVYYTEFGRDAFFYNLMSQWLKVPIELFLPQIFLATLVLMLVYRLSVDTWRTANIPATQQKSANYALVVKENREMANTFIILLFSVVALGVRIPKFILHVLTTEDVDVNMVGNAWHPHKDRPAFVALLYLSCHVMDVLFAAMKPFVLFLLGAHFRRSLTNRLCASCCCCTNDREILEIHDYNNGGNLLTTEGQPLTQKQVEQVELKIMG